MLNPEHLRAANPGNNPHVMGCDDDRRTEPVERFEQMDQPRCHLRIDIAGRFVGDEQIGLGDDRAGNRNALLLAARQGRRARTGPVRQPDPGQHLADRAFDLGLTLAGDPQGQRDIVERRQMPDQPKVLKHHADPAAEGGKRIARSVAQFLAEQADPATGRALGQIQQFEQ